MKTCKIKLTSTGRFMVLAGGKHHSFPTRPAAVAWARANGYTVT